MFQSHAAPEPKGFPLLARLNTHWACPDVIPFDYVAGSRPKLLQWLSDALRSVVLRQLKAEASARGFVITF
jgi:hypothetical protein